MLIQCTKKLLDQLNIRPSVKVEVNPLFSWHANLITLNRRKAVILVNDRNRYIVALYGVKSRDFKNLNKLIIEAVKEAFKGECIKDNIIEQFINQCGEIVYTTTKDKGTVARMNKSCEAVSYFQELLNNDSVLQNTLSKKASRFLVGNYKEYITPSEELFKDLESFSGQGIFSCRCAVIKAVLSLENHTVWRRIIIPVNFTFAKFHQVLQTAFGWKDYHPHEFYVYGNEALNSNYSGDQYINSPAYNSEGLTPIVNLVSDEEAFQYPNDVPMVLESNINLSEYIPKYKRLKYNYDFGDNWQHYIEVENIIDDYDKNYAVCIEGEGNTPPEDVGGDSGYEEFLYAVSHAEHPEHENMLIWGESQGYKEFDIEIVNRRLKYI